MDNQTPENSSSERNEINLDGNASDSIIISGSGNVITVAGEKAVKKPRRKAKARKTNKPSTTVIAALIGLAGTIIAALLNSPLVTNYVEPTRTPTPTISLTPTDFATATEYLTSTPIIVVVTSTEMPPTASPTFTHTPTSTLTPTLENTVTASPSLAPVIDTMTVVLQSSVDEGRAPLKVTFDARSSYVKFSTGSLVPCGNNHFCSYIFAIYRDSKFLEKISNNNGMLYYTLNGKGQYFVTVYVCRGIACNDDGLTVNVK